MPIEIFYMKKKVNKNISFNYLYISKIVFSAAIVILSCIDLSLAMQYKNKVDGILPIHFYTPLIKMFTIGLSIFLVYYNNRNGVHTSGILFSFWFSLMIFSIPRIIIEIAKLIKGRNQMEKNVWIEYEHLSYYSFCSLVFLVFFLNCFADIQPNFNQKNICPEVFSSFVARLWFSWFDKMALLGYNKSLETKDLWTIRTEDSSKEVSMVFQNYWKDALEKARKKNMFNASYSKQKGSKDNINIISSKPIADASILMPLIRAFGRTFLIGSFLKLLQDLLTFVNPHLLNLSINFVTSDEPMWKGIMYAITMFAVATLQTLLLGQYFFKIMIVGLRVRTSIIGAIYRKSLVISNAARKEFNIGEIVNLIAVDAQRFMDLTTYLNMLWSAPLQISLSLFFLWMILGPSVLAGLSVMIVLIPVNGYFANKIKILQIKQMQNKDERVNLMNQILNGIKVLKLYAWEPCFKNQISNVREKEIKVLKQAAYLNAGTSFIWSCAPFLVCLVTFSTYVLASDENILTPTKAFVALVLFDIIKLPLALLPMLVVYIVETSVSLKRINKFLNAEELSSANVEKCIAEASAILIENGKFQWNDEEIILKNINMKVHKKSLVAIVGSVGSGKSSLLSAILGEMDRLSGRVNIKGSVAYVPQEAWIQNTTLKNNVIFSKPFERNKFEKVIDSCALKTDMEILPNGDRTEIGEKGINLSGGQKQRINLARAVYEDADVYLLDDPLSAVDSHVGKHIFERVIGNNGLLSTKTRVLVTHSITFLPEVDSIFVLQDGQIIESGSYEELLEKNGHFSVFLLQHFQNTSEDHSVKTDKQLRNFKEDKYFLPKLDQPIIKKYQDTDVSDNQAKNKSVNTEEKFDDNDQNKDYRLIEEEKIETGNVKISVYNYYLKNIGWSLAVSTLLLNIFFQGFSIGSNIWLSRWSTDDRATESKYRNIYLGGYGGLGVGQVICTVLSTLLFYLGGLNAAKYLHEQLLGNILRAPITKFFDIVPIGRIVNRFSKDIDSTDTIIPPTVRAFFTCLFSVIATIIVISITTPIFITIIVPIGIIYFFVQRFYVATSRQLQRLESISRSPMYSLFGETLNGAATIRAYNAQERFIVDFETKVDLNQICYFPSVIANRWLAIRLEMIGNFIIFFAALFSVLAKDSSDELKGGLVGIVNNSSFLTFNNIFHLGLSLSYALQITQSLNWLVRMSSDVESNIVAVERIKEYVDVENEAPWEQKNYNLPQNWPEKGQIVFEKFSVRYREGLELVLKDISFAIKGGEKVGIVGRTGAGKSSISMSLFRVLEAANGKILIDGHDISKIGLHTLRKQLTVIPQDPVLFSGTLRMNLDPFEKKTDDELWAALENAHLKSFVKGLPAGLNHEIKEGGENLSVGQRQLVCLARALLRKTKIYVLDEATAAVDLETDDLIQRTIQSELKSCTVLTIAHRLNTIMDSDKIIVLDHGQMKEFAPPGDLLKNKNSIFYQMVKDANLIN
uniref:ABC-type glutathione-S-conjugate transporter n=1 Tax=Culicoides sonorensis TaxID=179676 RepID=A0A336KB87_CULSO